MVLALQALVATRRDLFLPPRIQKILFVILWKQLTIWRLTERTSFYLSLMEIIKLFRLFSNTINRKTKRQVKKMRLALIPFTRLEFMILHLENCYCSKVYMCVKLRVIFYHWLKINQNIMCSLSHSLSLIVQIWYQFFVLIVDQWENYLRMTKIPSTFLRNFPYSTRTEFKKQTIGIDISIGLLWMVLWETIR